MEDLISRIQRHEGFSPIPKPDAKGMWEIGYGHDIPPEAAELLKGGITQITAMGLLDNDIQECKEEMNSHFPWVLGLDDVRKDVLIEMIFQLGIAGVQHFPKMITAMRDKDYATAAKEILNSNWHKQTASRCEELANLMLNGGEDV